MSIGTRCAGRVVRAGVMFLMGAVWAGACGAQQFTATFRVVDAATNMPLTNANVRLTVTRGAVRAIQYPPDKRGFHLTIRGIWVDDTGTVTAELAPGEYVAKVSRDGFTTQTDTIVLPSPALPDETELTYEWRLESRESVVARSIIARVFDHAREADGTTRLRPFEGEPVFGHRRAGAPLAQVTARNEAGWDIESGFVNSLGLVRLTSADFVIGDPVTLRVEARGYVTDSKQIIIGSAQEGAPLTPEELASLAAAGGSRALEATQPAPLIPPIGQDLTVMPYGALGRHGTTTWDVAILVLVPGEDSPPARLIVEVRDKADDVGLVGAQVQVVGFDGAAVAAGPTGQTGRTEVLTVPVPPGPAPTGPMRLAVTCPPYRAANVDVPWSAVAASTRPNSEPATQIVYLRRGADSAGGAGGNVPPGWTECQKALFDRFQAWAEAAPAGRQIHPSANQNVVSWETPPDAANRTVKYYASIIRFPSDEELLQHRVERGREAGTTQAVVGGFTAQVFGINYYWRVGPGVELCTGMQGTAAENRAFAEAVAAAVGGCE